MKMSRYLHSREPFPREAKSRQIHINFFVHVYVRVITQDIDKKWSCSHASKLYTDGMDDP